MLRQRLLTIFTLLCLTLMMGLLPFAPARADVPQTGLANPPGRLPFQAGGHGLGFLPAQGAGLAHPRPGEGVTATGEMPLPAAASGDWWGRVQQDLAAREYQASLTPAGLQAPNRVHNWRVYFEPTGVQVVDRAADAAELLRLRLAGWGRAGRLEPGQAGEVINPGRRVEIRRPGLVEWYINGPRGWSRALTWPPGPRARVNYGWNWP